MGKYKDVLVRKLEQEEKDENEQARLRKETGIKNQAYRLKERSLRSYVTSALYGAGYVLYMGLAFLGVLAVLHPESRAILITIIRNMLPG